MLYGCTNVTVLLYLFVLYLIHIYVSIFFLMIVSVNNAFYY